MHYPSCLLTGSFRSAHAPQAHVPSSESDSGLGDIWEITNQMRTDLESTFAQPSMRISLAVTDLFSHIQTGFTSPDQDGMNLALISPGSNTRNQLGIQRYSSPAQAAEPVYHVFIPLSDHVRGHAHTNACLLSANGPGFEEPYLPGHPSTLAVPGYSVVTWTGRKYFTRSRRWAGSRLGYLMAVA